MTSWDETDGRICEGVTMGVETARDERDRRDEGEEVPVCVGCFRPVDRLAHYCPHCGAATGTFTHYLPFVNIRWQASVWGQAWRQACSRDVSVLGRLFRLIMIAWNVPIMLIGLLFRPGQEAEEEESEQGRRSGG